MAANFPKSMKGNKPQIQEARKTPSKMNTEERTHPGTSWSNF